MSRPRLRKTLATVLKAGVILLCFAYLFRVLWANVDQLQATTFRVRVWPLVASVPLVLGYLVNRGVIWHLIVRRVVGRFNPGRDILSWAASNLGKYIPGKVFLLLGRTYYYRKLGAAAGHVALAFLLEACCSCIAALAVFAVAVLSTSTDHRPSFATMPAVLLVIPFIALAPSALFVCAKSGSRFLPAKDVQVPLKWTDLHVWTAAMTANWFVLGLGFYLMLLALIDVPLGLMPYVSGAFAIAGIAGVLALFAPSGIGVRESVMTLILAQVLPAGVAVVAALVARLWLTLAEALFSAVALAVIPWLFPTMERGRTAAPHPANHKRCALQ
jgi:hypothetical protein